MATPIPTNRASFSIADIVSATGGEIVAEGLGAVMGISTDTRTLAEGAGFVALHGDAHDGHDHLDAAARAGAAIAIVDRPVQAPAGLSVVRVKDTLVALGDLARRHALMWRFHTGGCVVAVTGSAGKTTTRIALTALLAACASGPDRIHSAQGNLNNRVGVPMVLLGLERRHTAVVLEMGMNQPGEIAELCRIAVPQVGVLTLIAAAHTEGVGSIEGVAEEKGALLRALRLENRAVVNADDPRARAALARAFVPSVLYGHAPDADYRIVSRETIGMDSARVRVGDVEFTTPLLGEAGALACAAAIAVVEFAFRTKVDGALATRAFAGVDRSAGAGRLSPRVVAGDLAIIDDSYNANPASTCASIRAAAEIARATGRRLLLVLGEMRELGALSAAGHDEVGQAAGASGAAEVFAVGGGEAPRIAARAAEAGVRASHTGRVEDVTVVVKRAARPGDLVLVKGSRSTGTERIVAALAGGAS
jgi:UDP-N-acetylmuramoyl-tripeptide--D-alanyl-D-alanine ligase